MLVPEEDDDGDDMTAEDLVNSLSKKERHRLLKYVAGKKKGRNHGRRGAAVCYWICDFGHDRCAREKEKERQRERPFIFSCVS